LEQAIRNQDAIAKQFADNPPVWKEGIGERTMALDPLFRWLIKHYFKDDTRDPAFWKWFRGRFDKFKVRSVSPKIQVGYRAPASFGVPMKKVVGQRDPNYGQPFVRPGARFTKSYA
jgi:hypothetical protein